MNDAQRAVLQKHHMELARDIIVTEVLLGECFQSKLFDSHLIDIIRNDPSPSYKLLNLLPTRGPGAFDMFMSIIETDYHWLASLLQDSLDKELAKPREARSSVILPKLDTTDGGFCSPRLMSLGSPTEEEDGGGEIRNRVTTFMNRNFGLNRKLSQADKRAIEQFIMEQAKLERDKQCTTSMSSSEDVIESPDIVESSDIVKKNLFDCYIKMNVRMKALYTCEEKEENESPESGVTESVMTFNVLKLMIDTVLNRLEKVEDQISQCYDSLNDTERSEPLSKHIDRLTIQLMSSEQLLEDERRKTEKMTDELYTLSMNHRKMLQSSQLRDVELEVKRNQVTNLQREVITLQKEIDRLAGLNKQHLEKEKTLANLKEMVEGLKSSHRIIQEEKDNLSRKLTEQDSRSPRRQISKNGRYTGLTTNRARQPTRRKPISNIGNYRMNQP
ncbi:calcium-binding and coiled-coil domain-containing protein 2-like [Argopecten irradians]|uniref:calcium-binding and coiled-coil domain-containing protein 2-like n=1 Tax=Argopecten irradians TaxID=31199 RepID=UPI0037157CFF